MNAETLKQKFTGRLKEHFFNAHLKQSQIAEILKVSNSAVSQILTGKIILTQAQLELICERMPLTHDQYLEMVAMLGRIRSGFQNLRSPFNSAVFSYRCQQGMNATQLSKKSGIKPARLKTLETNFLATPSEDEIEALAKVFSITSETLKGHLTPMQDNNIVAGSIIPSYEVRETGKGYAAGSGEMLLELNDFRNFDKSCDVFEFAGKNSKDKFPGGNSLPVPTVAVSAEGEDLGLLWSGKVILHVSAVRPSNFYHVELCRFLDGSFRLRELKGRTWRDFVTRSRKKANMETVWALPVLEFSFHPDKGF